MQLGWPLVSERKRVSSIDPPTIDSAWARGWRHFGQDFFRDSLSLMSGKICRVTPLRVLLDDWNASKSEKRTIRKNAMFQTKWHSAQMGEKERELFHIHKERFTDNIPNCLENFLGWALSDYPCELMQCSVYDGDSLIACSYLDIGENAVSSVYGIFHPNYSKQRLGIYTMLAEMIYAQSKGFTYYYSGYATIERSSYDYKKSFCPQQFYQWGEEWYPMVVTK